MYTVEGFYYKQNPKKPESFLCLGRCRDFSFSQGFGGKYRDSYRIEVYFKNKENVKVPILSSSVEEKDSPLFIRQQI